MLTTMVTEVEAVAMLVAIECGGGPDDEGRWWCIGRVKWPTFSNGSVGRGVSRVHHNMITLVVVMDIIMMQ